MQESIQQTQILIRTYFLKSKAIGVTPLFEEGWGKKEDNTPVVHFVYQILYRNEGESPEQLKNKQISKRAILSNMMDEGKKLRLNNARGMIKK